MMYKVFSNGMDGRTFVDDYGPEDKTLSMIVEIYDDEYVKVDEYTNDRIFIRSFYLAPDDTSEGTRVTNGARTHLTPLPADRPLQSEVWS